MANDDEEQIVKTTPAPGDVVSLRRRAVAVVATLAVSALLAALQVHAEGPPAPLPVDAPADLFSAGRAGAILEELLAENVPHPVGTEANRRIRARIVARLEALGLDVEVQRALGCSASFPVCAMCENVIARLPGREAGKSVVLSAHYDSVPPSVGAGDDMAGVAAVLETARVLAAEGPFRNAVVFALTDGEEMGMLGAQAFYGQHPWAQDVGVVVNIEGAGSVGASRLMRSGTAGGWIVDLYGDTASTPTALSVADEVFRYMPNDTDLSVAYAAGWPGIDIAFWGERNHYHTPLDNLEELSLATVQHHGDNLLPLARALADAELDRPEAERRIYMGLFGLLFVSWSGGASFVIGALCLLLVLIAVALLRARGETTVRRAAMGFVVALAAVVCALIGSVLAVWLLKFAAGTMVAWPAHPWPLRIGIGAGAGVGVLAVCWSLGRLVDLWAALLGAWLCTVVFGLVAASVFAGAANLFLLPAAIVAPVIVAFVVVPKLRARPEVLVGLAVVVAAPFTLRQLLVVENGMGFEMIYAALLSLAFFLLPLVPFFTFREPGARRLTLRTLAGVAGVLALATVVTALVPLYSAHRPQHVNVYHLEDADQGSARWLVASTNPLPEAMETAGSLEPAVPDVRPWSILLAVALYFGETAAPMGEAPFLGAAPPTLETISVAPQGRDRRITLQLASSRGANSAIVLVPESVDLRRARIAGQAVVTAIPDIFRRHYGDYHALRISGLPGKGVELGLDVGSQEPFECIVADWTETLPPEADVLTGTRGALAVPVHQGDQSLVYRRLMVGDQSAALP